MLEPNLCFRNTTDGFFFPDLWWVFAIDHEKDVFVNIFLFQNLFLSIFYLM